MLEKLLLAVTMTFCLNLFLTARLPLKTQTASTSHPAQLTLPQLTQKILDVFRG